MKIVHFDRRLNSRDSRPTSTAKPATSNAKRRPTSKYAQQGHRHERHNPDANGGQQHWHRLILVYEKHDEIYQIFTNRWSFLRLEVLYYEHVVLSEVLFDFQWHNAFHQLNFLVVNQWKPMIEIFSIIRLEIFRWSYSLSCSVIRCSRHDNLLSNNPFEWSNMPLNDKRTKYIGFEMKSSWWKFIC